MKKTQIKELRSKDINELIKTLAKYKEDLIKIVFDLNSKKMQNVSLAANKRKDITIISTILKEKEITKV